MNSFYPPINTFSPWSIYVREMINGQPNIVDHCILTYSWSSWRVEAWWIKMGKVKTRNMHEIFKYFLIGNRRICYHQKLFWLTKCTINNYFIILSHWTATLVTCYTFKSKRTINIPEHFTRSRIPHTMWNPKHTLSPWRVSLHIFKKGKC